MSLLNYIIHHPLKSTLLSPLVAFALWLLSIAIAHNLISMVWDVKFGLAWAECAGKEDRNPLGGRRRRRKLEHNIKGGDIDK